MKTITLDKPTFDTLLETSKVISPHALGPKVIETADGLIIKFFNPKKGLTKRCLYPKYKAFINNAKKLKQKNIPTVNIQSIYYLPFRKTYGVCYQPLQGKDIRTLVQSQPAILKPFIAFVVTLHEQGIFFRGLHLGNVLRLSSGQMGIIDMADCYFQRGPLSIVSRVRNLAHMFKRKEDKNLFQPDVVKDFIKQYLSDAKIYDIQRWWFNFWLKIYLK